MTQIPMDSTRQRVWQAIQDLYIGRRTGVPRQLLAQHLNLKLSVVDEAVKRLKEDGLVRTVISGILEPVEQFPPDRPLSTTILPDGRYKLEVGDDVLDLTPHEAAVLGKMLQGAAMENAYWFEERQTGSFIVKLEAEVRQLRTQLSNLRHRVAAQRHHTAQPDMFAPAEAPTKPRRKEPAF